MKITLTDAEATSVETILDAMIDISEKYGIGDQYQKDIENVEIVLQKIRAEVLKKVV